MNLSPGWIAAFREAGHGSVHWSSGALRTMPSWARDEDRIVFTSDLDFGTPLAATGATKPSVVQLRAGTNLPSRIGALVRQVLQETEADLLRGALVTVEDDRVRLRPLIFDAKR